MKNLILALTTACFIVVCSICSCTYDNLADPNPPVIPCDSTLMNCDSMIVEFCDTIPATYDLNIRTIVETNCAYTGCHISGGAPGNYNTYEGMLSFLEDGRIEDRVIFQIDDPNIGMPPNFASGPQDLTPEEFDIFMCWLEAGYPEN